MSNPRVLMIVTSHDELGSSDTKTGFWLEELAAPYYELLAGGAAIDIASPKGASSEAVVVKRFLDDREATAKLESTRRLEDVDAAAYDAFFIVGGHGVMWDLAASPALGAMLGRAFDAGKVVAAVCHGPAGLVNARDASGAPIVAGRRVAGFSNEEEDAVGLTGVVPFALETKLRDLGGCYERGPAWSSFAVRDGTLVTGQNPASSAAVARLVVEALGA
jgi:putative intracellular protease/amidase